MKTLLFALAMTLTNSAFATIDANINVYILTKHVQEDIYFVQQAPLIGCYGLSKGPELIQLTKPYFVNNLGCGITSKENLNALSCAKVLNAVDDEDYSTFKEITLDISKCAAKDEVDFIDGIKKVVKLNFATKEIKEPILIIKK